MIIDSAPCDLFMALCYYNRIIIDLFIGMTASLAYFDQYRRDRLTSNLIQAQRDFFGSHTYERTDKPLGECFHTVWDESFGSADSITTSSYNA